MASNMTRISRLSPLIKSKGEEYDHQTYQIGHTFLYRALDFDLSMNRWINWYNHIVC